MNVPELLKGIGDHLHATASAKNVFGEPVTVADRTVIPVARVRYGFGGGGGQNRDADNLDGSGGGGGGHVSAAPAGFIEITPASSHFVPIQDWKTTMALIAVSLSVGFFIGRNRTR